VKQLAESLAPSDWKTVAWRAGTKCACGLMAESFELPGRSANVANAILLTTEKDVATLAGRSTNALVSEFSEISSRMLEQSQSAELGNG
jgi:hypothetical protein